MMLTMPSGEKIRCESRRAFAVVIEWDSTNEPGRSLRRVVLRSDDRDRVSKAALKWHTQGCRVAIFRLADGALIWTPAK